MNTPGRFLATIAAIFIFFLGINHLAPTQSVEMIADCPADTTEVLVEVEGRLIPKEDFVAEYGEEALLTFIMEEHWECGPFEGPPSLVTYRPAP